MKTIAAIILGLILLCMFLMPVFLTVQKHDFAYLGWMVVSYYVTDLAMNFFNFAIAKTEGKK